MSKPKKEAVGAGPDPAELPPRAKRRTPDSRREQILEAAILHFAEFGFEGGTQGLATRLGVTQPLIYRYFRSKDDLIKAVYDRVFIGGWRNEWTALVTDRTKPLRKRLIEFYLAYTEVIFQREWLLIYLHSSIKGLDIHRWWHAFVEEHIISMICDELRGEVRDRGSITPDEIEAYWLFHGGITYYGFRREIYRAPPRIPLDVFVTRSVDSLLSGYAGGGGEFASQL
ncbi:MAG: TetR/AcrR family transcriptional regulator [Sphingobium sp.]|nr:TetR/AcrR family transcriptional regulator [Sphingobium sp.]